jgi:hypothetical protein
MKATHTLLMKLNINNSSKNHRARFNEQNNEVHNGAADLSRLHHQTPVRYWGPAEGRKNAIDG